MLTSDEITEIRTDLERWQTEGAWVKAHSHISTLLEENAELRTAISAAQVEVSS